MNKKLLILALALGAGAGFYFLGGFEVISLDYFRSQLEQNPVQTGLIFFALYIVVTGLSLPGAAILTLIAGAVFGLGWGLLLASFASTIGASLAFLMSRALLGDWVQSKFSAQLETVNAGLDKEGGFYLFTLRLIPVIPFFIINLVFGLSRIKVFTFYWVSQVGMLAGTAVFVNAGAQLGAVEEISLAGILTPQIIAAFVLLGLFPWQAKALIKLINRKQADNV